MSQKSQKKSRSDFLSDLPLGLLCSFYIFWKWQQSTQIVQVKVQNDFNDDVIQLTTIAWSSAGFFMVGVENEIQVYSQWEDNIEVLFKIRSQMASILNESVSSSSVSLESLPVKRGFPSPFLSARLQKDTRWHQKVSSSTRSWSEKVQWMKVEKFQLSGARSEWKPRLTAVCVSIPFLYFVAIAVCAENYCVRTWWAE